MAHNPYMPPAQPDPAANTRQLAPADAAAIGKRIQQLNSLSLALGGPGLLIQTIGQFLGGVAGTLVTLLGTGLLIAGLVMYARMRGQSGWWGAMGLLSCVGMVVLLLLPKRCHSCGQQTKGLSCGNCGAPAPK